jgi:hypothetical protein
MSSVSFLLFYDILLLRGNKNCILYDFLVFHNFMIRVPILTVKGEAPTSISVFLSSLCNTSTWWWPAYAAETCRRIIIKRTVRTLLCLFLIDWASNCIHAQRDGNSKRITIYFLWAHHSHRPVHLTVTARTCHPSIRLHQITRCKTRTFMPAKVHSFF